MSKPLTWDDVLGRKDLIGGDVESIENNVAYRGPLSEIKVEGNCIIFTLPWCARRNPKTGEWENWRNRPFYVDMTVTPRDIGGGRVHFSAPFIGGCTLNPKSGSRLDPSKVKGLKR